MKINVGVLCEKLVDVPSTAIIFVEADHGQDVERCHTIRYSKDDIDDETDIEELAWRNDFKDKKSVTAILIAN